MQRGGHLARISQPALVVQTTADTGVFSSDARGLYEALAAADKTLEFIKADHYLQEPDGARAQAAVLLVLWRYAVRAKLVRPDLADEEIELLTQRLTPGLGAYLVLIVSGLFVPVIAVIGFLGIALYYIIPFRRLSASILPRGWRRKRHRR